MPSDRYKKFLESQAEKNPVKVERSGVTISWGEKKESTPSGSPSNLLESIYLGKEPKETVVVDRKAAMVLRERLTRLETEVDRMHKRIFIMKVLIVGLIGAATVLALWILYGG